MTKRGGPTWWVLYALLPLMAGLLAVEHRGALLLGWHTSVRIGIVLCIYGLVWLWIRVNAIALLRTGLDKPVKTYVYEADRAALRRPRRAPRPTHRGYVRAQQSPKYVKRTHRMEIDRCSPN
jgi:membrane peptidoglycan carboxypeptidase